MNTETIEQSILSIEDIAVNYAYDRFGSSNETQIEWEDCQEHFIAGANEMLPIIKELLEALKEIDEANNGIGIINTDWLRGFTKTTLDKYQNYL